MITLDELRRFHRQKMGADSRTAREIARRIGRKVTRCEIEHVCESPPVWRCFIIFDTTFHGKRWACEHAETRRVAINATVLTARKILDDE
jgi:hypothetical protein